MRLLLGPALGVLLASGCAGIDCQGADWRQVGERDGVLGAQDQGERYPARCGTAFDPARYREGFQDGFSRRPRPVV